MNTIEVKRIGDHKHEIPKHATGFSAGYDLRCVGEHTLAPGEQVLMPSGFAWAIPDGGVGLIKDRSSIAYKRGCVTHAGVIDCDYRGEVRILMRNESDVSVTFKDGDRVAQMIIVPYALNDCVEKDKLQETVRGDGGFGHTGEK
ncbi:MAG: dUTP diphosphatase [Candidatus Peribacteraceae bacterium]|nr:dUTP diphosphatase [Candidatus Peribacteraceae bacterium]